MRTAASPAELCLPETAQVPATSDAPARPHDGDDAHQEHGLYHAGAVHVRGPGDRSTVYTGGTTPEQYAEDLARLADAG